MDKDNVFCSSKFHLDTNDVLHILIRDLVGTVPTIVLYSEGELQEDIYPPQIAYTTINYGYLYNNYAVIYAGNIAPAGWHVPTKPEFETLVTYAGGFAVAGGKLKETGITHWLTPNTGATNEYGFNAVGCGGRAFDTGVFSSLQVSADYWSATSVNTMEMHYTLSNLFIFETFPGQGLSVRLIKDNSVDTGYMTGNNGKIYHTVKIGNQVWMANNLAETFYRDGTPISYVVSNADWVIAGNNALPSMCAYEHTLSNV